MIRTYQKAVNGPHLLEEIIAAVPALAPVAGIKGPGSRLFLSHTDSSVRIEWSDPSLEAAIDAAVTAHNKAQSDAFDSVIRAAWNGRAARIRELADSPPPTLTVLEIDELLRKLAKMLLAMRSYAV